MSCYLTVCKHITKNDGIKTRGDKIGMTSALYSR